MEDAPNPGPWGYAACTFGSTPGGKAYDYIAPFPVAVGDRVKVEARGGGWRFVTVAEIKSESASASASILEIMPAEKEDDADGE